eukprot:scaffold20658_cov101-Isochrysis_galbana.AAC.5
MEDVLHHGEAARLAVHGDGVAAVEAGEQRVRVGAQVLVIPGEDLEQAALLLAGERLDQIPPRG